MRQLVSRLRDALAQRLIRLAARITTNGLVYDHLAELAALTPSPEDPTLGR